MNLMKKVAGAIGFAACAAMAFVPAVARAGDIYRFEQTSAYSGATPASVGNEVTFRMLLKNPGDDTTEMSTNNFALVANPAYPSFAQFLVRYPGSEITPEMLQALGALAIGMPQPQMGVYVSGEERFADMEVGIYTYQNSSGYTVTNKCVTALNFTYTVKTGDWAYPFAPVNSSGKFPESTSFEGYHFANLAESTSDTTAPWLLMNNAGTIADLHYAGNDQNPFVGVDYLEDAYLLNVDDPIVIEGLGFSDAVSRTDGIWREIYEGTTDTYLSTAPSVTTGSAGLPSDTTTTVYVWVDPADESAVILDPAQSNIHTIGGTNFLYLTVAQGATGASFALKGVSQTGGENGDGVARVYISQFLGIRDDAQGVALTEKLMRKVQCVEPPEPYISLTIRNGEGTEADTITAPSWTDVRTPAATITVGISKSPEVDTTLELTFTTPGTTGDGGTQRDIRDYIGTAYSTQGNSYQGFTNLVTFAAGTTELTKTLNVFVYDADELTRGDGITIAVKDTAATPAYTPQAESYSLYLVPFTPSVTAPEDDITLGDSYPANSIVPIEVTVDDTYFNSTNEYTVAFSNGSLSTNVVTATNGVATINATFYATGLIKCGYTLTDKDGRSTARRYVSVNVEAAKTVSLVRVDESLNEIPETVHRYAENGDEDTDPYYFRVQLSENLAYGGAIYAYLNPLDAASTNALAELPPAVRIQPTFSVSDSAFAVRFVDGNSNTANLSYNVVLKTGNEDTSALYSDVFSPSTFYASVTNVPPAVPASVLNGAIVVGTNSQDRSTCANVVVNSSTSAMVGNVSLNATKTFYVNQLSEPSTLDLSKVERDAAGDPVLDDEGNTISTFQTRWSYWYNNQQLQIETKKGNPLEATDGYTVKFTKAGTYTIQVECRDGDMATNKWGPAYTFNVIVNPRPSISITTGYTDQRVSENATNVRLTPTLSEAADVDLELKITVTENSTGDNKGTATLSTNLVTVAAGDTRPGEYPLLTLDGTPAASTSGFNVKVEVVTDAVNADGVNYTNLYYQASPSPMKLYVENVAPTIMAPSISSQTNKASLGTAMPISWKISDVAADITASEGITLHWLQDGAAYDVYVTTNGVVNADGTVIEDEQTTVNKRNSSSTVIAGTSYFTFTSSGSHTVTLQAEDKDGDTSAIRYIYFECEESKALKLVAGGPGKGISDSDEATAYRTATGAGAGYIYTTEGAYVGNALFQGTWNFSTTAGGANVFAKGYKVGDVHDKSFNANFADDWGINTKGNSTAKTAPAAGSEYNYPGSLDSFFYCWIQNDTSGGTAGGTTSNYTASSPDPQMDDEEVLLPANIAQNNTSQGTSVNYKDKVIEAVFSKEWRASDNMGDINADGIPDYFAVGSGPYSFALGKDEDDLQLLNNYNDDLDADGNVAGDFLPGAQPTADGKTGRKIIPSLTAGWDTDGGAFTALLELRGFHDGLNNTGTYNGQMVSDVDMSDAEWIAFVKANPGVADEAVNGDEVDASVLTEDQTNAVKTVLMNTWSPENPTNPKSVDTDGDGINDGYEYYFWYHALVNGLHGRKFSTVDPTYGEVITPEEILARFNPTVRSEAATSSDLDNDGLTDLEELAIGTNPIDWDTDGDFMPDGWEVMWGMSPLAGGADGNEDDDAMAFYDYSEEGGTFTIIHKNGTGFVAVESGDEDITAAGSATGIKVIYNPVRGEFVPCGYAPNGKGGHLTVVDEDSGKPLGLTDFKKVSYFHTSEDTFERWEEFSWSADDVDNNLMEKFENKGLTLIHQQVRDFVGYDPRTAWHITQSGYVSNRWADPTSDAGKAVNTRGYENYDEFFTAYYLREVEHLTSPTGYNHDRKLDSWDFFLKYTTCPTKAHTTNTYVESLLAAINSTSADWNQTVDGADTNGDGVPDGWALYVGRMACSPIHDRDKSADDFDHDGLSLVAEYSGTDTCGVFSDVESIASTWNHRWANKFFPTDPDDADTDGDGISDSQEGGSFSCIYRDGEREYTVSTPTGYWMMDSIPMDSAKCYRGGGMNPCSIDTDGDGLPDPWEAQYIGMLMRADGVWFIHASTSPIKPQSLPDSFWAMNGLDNPYRSYANSTNTVPEVDGSIHYELDTVTYFPPAMMVLGMDPTWDGDASSVMSSYENNGLTGVGQSIAVGTGDTSDDVTALIREVDFDADGLQNFQEYLVQALRHFRYDDIFTPLMGRQLANGRTLGDFKGFVTFDALNEAGYKLACDDMGFATTFIDFADLGYFADPPKAWDKEAQGNNPKKYMLPPKVNIPNSLGGYTTVSASKYFSTDPRFADTDGDGMDDYYEIFHGLNPLYGADPDGRVFVGSGGVSGKDIIAENALGFVTATDNAWTKAFGYESGTYVPYNSLHFPWLAGSPYADPDGDGLRNYEEAIIPNVTAPRNYHTDPTPLWFTDPSGLKEVNGYNKSENASFVSQYYVTPEGLTDMFSDSWNWRQSSDHFRYVKEEIDTLSNDNAGTLAGSSLKWMYAFEANEGFDTDSDWRGDSREMIAGVEGASDPINFTDLDRRQGLYLTGDKSLAITREPGLRSINASDLLRQFTVECWTMPEELKDSVIVERAVWYTASSQSNAVGKVRANFRIAMNSDGNVYGAFDSADAVDTESSSATTAIVTGPVLDTDKWTHLALSFDGSKLSLYVNGTLYHAANNVTLQPANGVLVQIEEQVHAFEYPVTSYAYTPAATLVGAQANTAAALLISSNDYVNVVAPEWGDYGRFFKGYVDEVRVWDGARTSTEIKADYKKRYTFADVQAQREEVYTQWVAGSRRWLGTLPPELVQHYSFCSIPGATDADSVAQNPSGFEKAVADQTGDQDHPIGLDISAWWWKELGDAGIASTVYKDRRSIPWIQNTVQHLPAMDTSSRDSLYYAAIYAGFEGPLFMGVTEYAFPNAADPYGWSNYLNDRVYRWRRLSTLAALRSQDDSGVDYSAYLKRFRFQLRSDFVGTSDMIPLGGAFAKRADSFWDDQGAMDAWADTVKDTDGDGLPDWWEELYGLSNDEDSLRTMVDYDWGNGTVRITAAEAYLRDLAHGMLPDASEPGDFDTAYLDRVDSDSNGLPDWWETLYGLTGTTGDDDSDSDGLSNRAEYLISEIFQYYLLNPTLPRTPDANTNGETVLDSFKKVGQLYLAEMFDDHDKIEGSWEAIYTDYLDSNNRKFIDNTVFDATGDLDEDGWSNWAEARAGKAPVRSAILGVDGDELEEYPVPVITMSTYSPVTIGDGSIVVKAWSQKTLGNPIEFDHAPDAVWTIGGTASELSREKYVGMNPGKVINVNLGPGSVAQGSINIALKDIAWEWGAFNSGVFASTYKNATPSLSDWANVVVDQPRVDGSTIGDLVLTMYSGEKIVGTIDYETGAAEIDFTAISGREYFNWVDNATRAITPDWTTIILAGSSSSYTSAVAIDMSRSFVKMTWTTKSLAADKTGTYYLSYADTGHVKEGLNTFEVFADRNGDGVYTPGTDLYGVVRNVDVGFENAKFNIELTEVSPIFDRVDITTGDTDRGTLYGTDSGDYTNLVAGVFTGGSKTIVKVVRTAINGTAVSDLATEFPNAFTTNMLNAVVMERIVDTENRTVLTERDFMTDDVFDIDWNNLTNINGQLKKAYSREIDITNVLYRIVLGNGTTEVDTYNNLLGVGISRTYDGKQFRDIPVPKEPASNGERATVYASHPTFVWTTTNMNSYTAFQLQIKDANKSKTVWDSGIRPLPKRDALGRYVWEAPVYAGDQVLDTKGKGSIFGNLTNYTWRVRVMNSKFQDDLESADGWSDLEQGKFRMNVNGTREIHDGGYSSIKAAVKYRGPSQVLTNRGKATDVTDPRAKVRVQVYSSADFTGTPVSQGVLLDVDSLTNSTETANISLGGLPDGTYYVCAYIDSDGDMKRSAWESWGYACGIGDPADANYFSPQAIVIDSTTSKAPEVTVWIDDCDTDGDWLPDAWEYAMGGNLLTGPDETTGDDAFAWYVNVNPKLQDVIKDRLTASLTGATLDMLAAPQLAALALGATPADASVAAAKAAIQAVVAPEIEADGISIDSIEIDANGKVYISVSAGTTEGDSTGTASAPRFASSPAASTYVTSSTTYYVDCTIYHTASLSEPFEPIETRTLTIVDGQVQEDFEIETDKSATAGFFKAVFEKHQ